MPTYSVFGTCLQADVELPGLRPAPAHGPRWVVRTAAGTPQPDDGVPLGREAYPSCVRTLGRAGGELRYRHSCTGTFAIAPAARSITWWPARRAHRDSVAGDIVGRVLAIALHAEGRLCLHASAVTVDGALVAFLAVKGTGKSTLAAAMVNAGATLLTDDMLAVDLAAPGGPAALPGVDILRLRDDAARLCPSDAAWGIGADGKRVLAGLAPPSAGAPARRRPIAALYLLQPAPADAELARAAPLPGARAAIALLPHVKVGALLGPSGAADVFARVAALAATVPVHALAVPRRLDRVADVAAQLTAWHAAPRPRAVAW